MTRKHWTMTIESVEDGTDATAVVTIKIKGTPQGELGAMMRAFLFDALDHVDMAFPPEVSPLDDNGGEHVN